MSKACASECQGRETEDLFITIFNCIVSSMFTHSSFIFVLRLYLSVCILSYHILTYPLSPYYHHGNSLRMGMHVAAVTFSHSHITLNAETATRHCIRITCHLYTCYTCIPFNMHTTVSTAQSIGIACVAGECYNNPRTLSIDFLSETASLVSWSSCAGCSILS